MKGGLWSKKIEKTLILLKFGNHHHNIQSPFFNNLLIMYIQIKNSVAHQMIKQACELFPQMEDKIDLIEIGTPITNKHYIGSPHGEIYGLDHDYQRMSPWMMALTRPETDIPGLYITGQDALLCGFTGALFGGLLCASTLLKRNVMQDLENLHAKLENK